MGCAKRLEKNVLTTQENTHECSVTSQDEENQEYNHRVSFLERDHRLVFQGHSGVGICGYNLKQGKPVYQVLVRVIAIPKNSRLTKRVLQNDGA